MFAGGCLVSRVLLLLALGLHQAAVAIELQAFSFEEADGAIATAEQHIVQEQSHIIETLNKKLAQMKTELEMDSKKIADLEKEKVQLKSEVSKDLSLVDKTRETALANQETLQKVIAHWKDKEKAGERQLQDQLHKEKTLTDQIERAKQKARKAEDSASSAEERYQTLLDQKKQAIARAEEIKEQKAAKRALSEPAKTHGWNRRKMPLKPKFLSIQSHSATPGVTAARQAQPRQNFLQGQHEYDQHRPLSWGAAPGPHRRRGAESMF